MKFLAGVGVLLAATVMLSGCSSDYVMATKDGRMILTSGKPNIDKDTGLVSYTDQSGNKMQINGDDISTMIER
ncbi:MULTISPECIES: YgdI/YgdR family lipoprotein [Pantoea]|uniref:YgdI/YgdR family lipoprotein n=1 Tax=Candidatus Pantoea multigeneris TaxID=2608357 RepID=A0ABX0RCX2_9GAMM|nr:MULTISPECIES: YgdI/YgdR family lipoprotein [Pantoea]NIF23212.1 YgdI/YgdR family lipoprotein [Pantoea multigeneris]